MVKRILYYISHWESWHWFAKYILISPVWLWYFLKARSLWFYTSSNPSITFGGYLGETKEEVYKLLPPGSYPESIFVSPSMSLTEIVRMIDEKGFDFPVAVKAASGIMGFMFRKIISIEHLHQYHAYMPLDYIIQEYVNYKMEVSVFYYRYPDQQKGTITGFVKKELPKVTGDGKQTLWQLMMSHPGIKFKIAEMKKKHVKHLDDILPEGQEYVLSHAINLSRGGKLISLAKEKDERLLNLFDSLSHYSGQLYFGRYDIRCESVEQLKEGNNFKILEFNGCGGEPHHVYGDHNSLWKACRILLYHWKVLYKIADYNHRHGYPRWAHRNATVFFKKSLAHIIRLKKLDQGFAIEPEEKASTATPSMFSSVEAYS